MSQASEPDSPPASEGPDSEDVSFPRKHRFAFRSDVGEVLDFQEGDEWAGLTSLEDTLDRLLLMGLRQQASELRLETSVDEDGHWSTVCSLTIDKQYLPVRNLSEEFSATIRRRIERDDGLVLEMEPIAEWAMWWVVEEIERLAGFGQLQGRPSGRFYIRVGRLIIEVLVSIDAWREGIRHVLGFDGCDLGEVSRVDQPDSPAASEGLEQVSFPRKHRFAFRSNLGEVFDFGEERGDEWETLTTPEQFLVKVLMMGIVYRASELRFETSVDGDGHRSTACSFLTDKPYPPVADMPEEIEAMIRRRVERDDGLLLEMEPIAEPEMSWVVEEIERLAGFGHLGRRPSGRFYITIGGHGFEVLVSIVPWREGIRHVLRIDACDLSGVSPVDED